MVVQGRPEKEQARGGENKHRDSKYTTLLHPVLNEFTMKVNVFFKGHGDSGMTSRAGLIQGRANFFD